MSAAAEHSQTTQRFALAVLMKIFVLASLCGVGCEGGSSNSREGQLTRARLS